MKKLLALVLLLALPAQAAGVTILTNGFLTINDTTLVVAAATSPTGSQQRITSAGNVAWVVGAPATMVNGQIVFVTNVDTVDTITITVGATVIGPACALAPGDNAILSYDNTLTKWKVMSCYQGAAASQYWTLDGTSQTVTAAKAMTLANVANALSFDGTTFSIDALGNRVGVRTIGPVDAFTVNGSIGARQTTDNDTYHLSINTSGGVDARALLYANGLGAVEMQIESDGSGFAGAGFVAPHAAGNGLVAGLRNNNGTETAINYIAENNLVGGAAHRWWLNLGGITTQRMSIDSTGLVFPIDTNATLTGGVNGFSFDGTTFSVDATNHRVGFGTAAPAVRLDVVGAGAFTSTVSSVGLLNTGTANTSGTTTANLWTSNVTATAGVDTMWKFDATVTNASDFVMAWSAGTTVGMTYAQTNGSAGAPVLLLAAGTLEMSVASGAGFVKSNASNAATNLTMQSGCNASGETCVGAYSSANLSGATLDATLFNIGHNSGSTIVYAVLGSGHHISTASTPSSFSTGATCTTPAGTGDDYTGTLSAASCTAGQTMVATFNRAYATAPRCVATAGNSAAGTGLYFVSSSTTTVTVTSIGITAAPSYIYICNQ